MQLQYVSSLIGNAIWTGSLIMGLEFCVFSGVDAQLPPPSFHHIKTDERLLSFGYHCLAEDRYGFIWFGSRQGGGLYRYDGNDLKSFVVDPENLHASLPSNHINTVVICDERHLYVGTHEGMATLDIIDGTIKSYIDDVNKVPDPSALYLEPFIPDSINACTWIGSSFGLHKLNWKTDSVEFLSFPIQNNDAPALEGVIDLQQDIANPNILWLGTRVGLFSYLIDQHELRFHSPDVYIGVILDLYQDPAGRLWIAADDVVDDRPAAVIRLLPQQNVWTRFDIEGKDSTSGINGGALFILPSIWPDLLWVSTFYQVGLFDMHDGKFKAWRHDPSRPDGLLPGDFYRSMLADRHGRLWITSWRGIQYSKSPFVPPGKNAERPSVSITDVHVSPSFADSMRPLLWKHALSLTDDQRDISFRYVLPNPLDPRAVAYQYMLKGREKAWTTTDQRTIQYTGLKGGDYVFMIKAKEGDGEWSEVTELPFSIERKLAEHFWFWIIAAIAITGILVGINRLLINRTRKEEKIKAEYEKKVSEIEMQALRAQMNPHFLFNSLNSIKYYAISKDKNATAEYLSKFALLVRTILNNSKSRTITLKDELAALRLYIEIEHLRLEGKFDFEIEVDSSIRVEEAQIPPMVLQPYVENAIWHGLMHRNGGGLLRVHVKELEGMVQCVIEDNGVGRKHARAIKGMHQNHKESLGMKITADRIALINKIYGIETQVHVIDLYDERRVAAGTRVVINIPIIDDTGA